MSNLATGHIYLDEMHTQTTKYLIFQITGSLSRPSFPPPSLMQVGSNFILNITVLRNVDSLQNSYLFLKVGEDLYQTN